MLDYLPTKGRGTSCTYALSRDRLLEQRASYSAAYSPRAKGEEAEEIVRSPL